MSLKRRASADVPIRPPQISAEEASVVAPQTRTVSTIVSPQQELDTPAMAIDEEILHQNIAEMQALANSHGVNLRPHIKTHKMPQIALQQIAAGAVGITC